MRSNKNEYSLATTILNDWNFYSIYLKSAFVQALKVNMRSGEPVPLKRCNILQKTDHVPHVAARVLCVCPCVCYFLFFVPSPLPAIMNSLRNRLKKGSNLTVTGGNLSVPWGMTCLTHSRSNSYESMYSVPYLTSLLLACCLYIHSQNFFLKMSKSITSCCKILNLSFLNMNFFTLINVIWILPPLTLGLWINLKSHVSIFLFLKKLSSKFSLLKDLCEEIL